MKQQQQSEIYIHLYIQHSLVKKFTDPSKAYKVIFKDMLLSDKYSKAFMNYNAKCGDSQLSFLKGISQLQQSSQNEFHIISLFKNAFIILSNSEIPKSIPHPLLAYYSHCKFNNKNEYCKKVFDVITHLDDNIKSMSIDGYHDDYKSVYLNIFQFSCELHWMSQLADIEILWWVTGYSDVKHIIKQYEERLSHVKQSYEKLLDDYMTKFQYHPHAIRLISNLVSISKQYSLF